MLPPLVFALFLVGGDDTVCVDIGLLFFVVCLVVGIMRAEDNVLWCSLHVRGTSIPTRIDAAMIHLALEGEFSIVPSVVSKIEISARFEGKALYEDSFTVGRSHCTKIALQWAGQENAALYEDSFTVGRSGERGFGQRVIGSKA